jgi:hypothetical protein
MVKDIVIVADLGAAGNLVRNLLLLSNQIDWPMLSDRFHTVINQYQKNSSLDKWLDTEQKLRFWHRYYNVDLSNDIDLDKFQQRKIVSSPVVYLNHSAFYQQPQYQKLKDITMTLYIAPTTDFGNRWQIRSYCEKKTVEKLHNFTFETDIDQQRKQYCQTHGEDAYHKLNIKNFAEIVKTRQQNFGTPDIALETLLYDTADKVVDVFRDRLDITVDIEQATVVLDKWRQCHWPIDTTDHWRYYDYNA